MRPFSLANCRFAGNWSTKGGGLFLGTGWPDAIAENTISNCVFEANTAANNGGGTEFGRWQGVGYVTLEHCTLARNSAPLGGGMHIESSVGPTWTYIVNVDVVNSIIAFGTGGEAVSCDPLSVAVLSCTDIFANAGGDWTGCIADQYGIIGCFAADPRFCNPLAGDFTLAEDSPCSPAHSPAGCGLIGALPVGCVTPIGMAEAGPPAAQRFLRVAPNPIIGDATVEWSGPGGAIEVIDPLGRVVLRHDARGAGRARWEEIAGARRLPSGVYFLRTGGAAVRVVVMR